MGEACIISKTTENLKLHFWSCTKSLRIMFLFDLIYYLFWTFFSSDIDRVFCIMSPWDPHVKQMKTEY